MPSLKPQSTSVERDCNQCAYCLDIFREAFEANEISVSYGSIYIMYTYTETGNSKTRVRYSTSLEGAAVDLLNEFSVVSNTSLLHLHEEHFDLLD